ncbi:hypothetical protein OHA53_19665 [Streptomyces althioticus]|uniref:hypothetical protein n=1 Tax=Streptomyces althioticus TaxID=83380 RepID=UPI0038731AE6|nr:hypothetical protein OHA53_19665 [Streptomyces althioticus]
MTSEERRAKLAADEAELCRLAEWRLIARRLDALYAAQIAGDDSILTRQRIQRMEALQMALMGHPEAMAA